MITHRLVQWESNTTRRDGYIGRRSHGASNQRIRNGADRASNIGLKDRASKISSTMDIHDHLMTTSSLDLHDHLLKARRSSGLMITRFPRENSHRRASRQQQTTLRLVCSCTPGLMGAGVVDVSQGLLVNQPEWLWSGQTTV